jgi:hypothetical protein
MSRISDQANAFINGLTASLKQMPFLFREASFKAVLDEFWLEIGTV